MTTKAAPVVAEPVLVQHTPHGMDDLDDSDDGAPHWRADFDPTALPPELINSLTTRPSARANPLGATAETRSTTAATSHADIYTDDNPDEDEYEYDADAYDPEEDVDPDPVDNWSGFAKKYGL